MNTQEKQINNLEELIEYLNKLLLDKNHLYVFRGYSKEEEMLPKLIRKNAVEKEFQLLDCFEKYALRYISNVNGALDLLAYAQHFGLPTRLLDFTYNPYIALFFALNSEKQENDDPNYYIRYCDVKENVLLNGLPLTSNRSGLSHTGVSLSKDYHRMVNYLNVGLYNNENNKIACETIFGKECEQLLTREYFDQNEKEYFGLSIRNKIEQDKILFLEPPLSNERIIMQQGLFMFPYTLNEERHKKIYRKSTDIMKFSKNLRGDALRYLDSIGSNTFKLMPDLGNVCMAIQTLLDVKF